MMDDKELTQVELDTLVDIVRKFSNLYYNYPVIGVDSTSVHIHKNELFRLAKELEVEITNKVYTTSSGIFDCNWFDYEGIRFHSQDTLEEYNR